MGWNAAFIRTKDDSRDGLVIPSHGRKTRLRVLMAVAGTRLPMIVVMIWQSWVSISCHHRGNCPPSGAITRDRHSPLPVRSTTSMALPIITIMNVVATVHLLITDWISVPTILRNSQGSPVSGRSASIMLIVVTTLSLSNSRTARKVLLALLLNRHRSLVSSPQYRSR